MSAWQNRQIAAFEAKKASISAYLLTPKLRSRAARGPSRRAEHKARRGPGLDLALAARQFGRMETHLKPSRRWAENITLDRRSVLRGAVAGAGTLAAGRFLAACGNADAPRRVFDFDSMGPLGEPDENGIRLPVALRSRIVARSGELPIPGGSYVWHGAPDGGAVFAAADGGWIYVSNSERLNGAGGVGALRFSSDGSLVEAYPILEGSSMNCAGGSTPWGTWLSCEEDFFQQRGRVIECDPFGVRTPIERPALGLFIHEAACIDPRSGCVYLTEDAHNGRFYRFTPDEPHGGARSLESGRLEAAKVGNVGGDTVGLVEWIVVPDPLALGTVTRLQVPEASAFDGGEGIWLEQGLIYFSTKGDNRVWTYDPRKESLRISYDVAAFAEAPLTGVDNVTGSGAGDILVAEDAGRMQIVVLTRGGSVVPLLQVVDQPLSEITGPAFDPSGTRLYFSSQRGSTGQIFGATGGITYEIQGF